METPEEAPLTNKQITDQLLEKSRELKEKHKRAQLDLETLNAKIYKHVHSEDGNQQTYDSTSSN